MGEKDAGVSEFAGLIDLASERLGGRALAASDEFFAPKENLLKPGRAVFIPDKYTEFGKWMDGWESRRKREPGHDWCIVALGHPGIIRGVNVDTGHFRGNQPEACTVEATEIAGNPEARVFATSAVKWTRVTERTTLAPDSEHLIPALGAAAGARFTHVRLNIFPDGGVARLRVHGEVVPDWKALGATGGLIDLAAAENGGLVVAANDMHFGSRHNLIMPGRAANMGDGWETRRKRGLTWKDGRPEEHDWAVVRLGHRGMVGRVEVDTNHFKGNFPESCQVEVCESAEGGGAAGSGEFNPARAAWTVLLPRTKLKADARQIFEKGLDPAATRRPATHARLSIFPDGGVSRLRLHGTIAR